MRVRARAARIFDPFYLEVEEDHILFDNIKGLKSFGYEEFDDLFLLSLKLETPKLVEYTKEYFDWDNIPSSSLYQTRLQGKKKQLPQFEATDSSWKDDPGERSQKIWEWWRILLSRTPTPFPTYAEAVRLVVLTQVSSCSVERVFSKLAI